MCGAGTGAARVAAAAARTGRRLSHGRAASSADSKGGQHFLQLFTIAFWARWRGRAHDEQFKLGIAFFAVVFK